MTDKTIKRRHYLIFIAGGLSVILFILLFNKTVEYTSSNEFCNSCHIHTHAEASWRLSVHNNTSSGVSVKCVDCHLPPEDQTAYFLSRKAYHGAHDLYVYLTKDADEIDWQAKRSNDAAKRFVYEDGCLKCHTNLFPSTLSSQGGQQHLKYIRNPQSSSCLQCHHEMGHYRGEQSGFADEESETPKEVFKELTVVNDFKTFEEKIPGTAVSFKMIAVPGGTFKMGSPQDEPYRRNDEGPVREVAVDSLWMAEIEVSWDEYLAFFSATSSQGRKEAVELDEETDGVSGATPPWGAPDQGWGKGSRPAITMSHHAAETYCRWLSQVTGRKYRLPTEAEWEYAARGGTQTPYFFEGSPKDYEADGFLKKLLGANTGLFSQYVVWNGNSPGKTQQPDVVESNPFGLKNMLGNVAEFCLDYYDPSVYGKYPKGVIRNPRGPRSGSEHVVRGGSFQNTPKDLRVARRDFTRTTDWLVTDPQIPKSIWWYSDVKSVGFRVICEYHPEELKNTEK
ncbi:SUMF1/EgtB/PvdO family nonheme iron enzyme [Maribellus sp. YY47]|uniref:SUMF1/EgtB/PvdO family nonheme iron enzyme n=1 Tax=Maribellus sp. YY47 TaxID=2929486 RepID=UPI002001BFE1|nr:SUMF1/EgtB/PvdO family nonheme iron enzyme [Maribellus sp. YY47]MCK3683699.1 SUMF1/EgtB/PvdO family nonheme iron enzyme [Maribellus sp. YY47]